METDTVNPREDSELPANITETSSGTGARRPETPVLLQDAQNSEALENGGGAALTPESKPTSKQLDPHVSSAAPISPNDASATSDESKAAKRAAKIAAIKKRLQARKEADAAYKNSTGGDKSAVVSTPTTPVDEKAFVPPTVETEEENGGASKSRLASRKAASDARRVDPEIPLIEPETPPVANSAHEKQSSRTKVKDGSRRPRQAYPAEKSTSRSSKASERLSRDPKHDRSVPRTAPKNEFFDQKQSRDKSKPRASVGANGSVNRSRGESIPRKVLSAQPKPPSPSKSQTATTSKKGKTKFTNQKDRAVASSIAEDLKRIRESVNKSRMELDKRVAAFALTRNKGSFAEEYTPAATTTKPVATDEKKADKSAGSSAGSSKDASRRKKRSGDKASKKPTPASGELRVVAGKELQIPQAGKWLPPKDAKTGEVQILGTSI